MQTLIDLLTAFLPMAYGLAAVNYQVYFIRRDPFAERTCTPFLFGTWILHWIYALTRTLYYGRPPVVGLGEALGIIAIAITGVYLYVEKLQENKHTGAFIIPLVVLVQLASSAMMPQVPAAPKSELLRSPLFGVHAIIAILGYSAFAVAFVYGVMYLLLYRVLKKKNFQSLIFDRLPSLDTLANMGFWSTLLGWIALTITIGIGIVMSIHLVPGFYEDPKFIGTVLVWVVYGLGVGAHIVFGWRGARSVYLSIVGFAFAVITMFGSSLIGSTFHNFQT